MKVRGVDFLVFYVSEQARSVDFYARVLGLTLNMRSEEYKWAEFDCGNVTLALQTADSSLIERNRGRVAFAVSDATQAYEELLTLGISIGVPPVNSGYCIAFELLDPDGNCVIMHQRLDGTCA